MMRTHSVLGVIGTWMTVLAVGAGIVGGQPAAASTSGYAERMTFEDPVIEIVAGSSGAVDVAPGPSGSVWVALPAEKLVARVDRSGIEARVHLTGSPNYLASDGEGGVWVTEQAESVIAHIESLETIATEWKLPIAGAAPTRVHDAGADVFVALSATSYLARFDEEIEKFSLVPFFGGASPVSVSGVNGRVWAVDKLGNTVVLDSKGQNGLVVAVPDRWQSISVASPSDHRSSVRGVVSRSDAAAVFTWDGGMFARSSLVLSGRGGLVGAVEVGNRIWFADSHTNTIGWVLGRDRAERVVPSAGSGLSGLVVTEGRYIWSAESATGKVVRVDSAAIDVQRVGGMDRYELAVNISKTEDYSDLTNRTVFVASGEVFPDALSAGPIAAHNAAPILLTTRASLPASTRDEIIRIAPTQVIVVGGPATVLPAVVDSIKAAVPLASVERVEGPDRYAVSRALLTGSLAPRHPITLYVANGRDFPDALSSTAAAAHLEAGILLVDGSAASLTAEEMAIINEYSVTEDSVRIAGGPASVSRGIEAQIATVATVKRLGGADRYDVSQAIVRDAFGTTPLDLMFLASGSSFPDALAGGVGASYKKSAVLLSHPDCVPEGALDQISARSPRLITLYGGPATLTSAVESLTPCA